MEVVERDICPLDSYGCRVKPGEAYRFCPIVVLIRLVTQTLFVFLRINAPVRQSNLRVIRSVGCDEALSSPNFLTNVKLTPC